MFYFRCRVLSTLEYNNLLTNDYSTFICESNNLGDVMFPDGGSTEAEIVCNEGIFSGLYSDSVSTLSLQYFDLGVPNRSLIFTKKGTFPSLIMTFNIGVR